MNLTWIDFVVIAIIAISTIFAMLRGFVSETLSIVGWAAAALAALYFGHYGVPIFAHFVKAEWLAKVLGYAAVFFIVLIPISMASFRISQGVRESSVGLVDRTLGALFGIARGLVIVGGLYILFSLFVPLRDQPASLKESRLLPVIQDSAEALIALAPPEDRPAPNDRGGSQLSAGLSSQDETGQTAHSHATKTYGAADRRALDRLVGASDSGKGQ
jgi:membrane protein required for colicin V production